MGNTNAQDPVVNLFPTPVFVRYVRLIPLEAKFLPALRVELKGCNKTGKILKVFKLIETFPSKIFFLTNFTLDKEMN